MHESVLLAEAFAERDLDFHIARGNFRQSGADRAVETLTVKAHADATFERT